MYSKLHYKDKIQPCMQAVIEAENIKTRGEKLNVVKRVTREMWEGEDESVKASVNAKLAEKAATSLESARSGAPHSPEQFAR